MYLCLPALRQALQLFALAEIHMDDESRILIPPDVIYGEPVSTGRGRYEYMFAQLLLDDVVFLNHPHNPYDTADQAYCGAVNCNDVFAWACADSEPLLREEVPHLYELHMADPI